MSAGKNGGPSPGSTIEWASALASLPDPLFIMEAVRGPDGTVVELTYSFLNEAAARLYGMSVDEVVGHGQCELFPSVRELGIWDTYLGVIESGSPASFNVPYFNENGVEGSFRLTATKFGDGLLVSASDTTDQVKAEEAVEGDLAVLRATLDSLMDPHVRLGVVRDEDGQIIDFVYVDANPAACEYNKRTYEELIGARLLDLFPGSVGTGLLKMYADVVETGEPLVLDDYAYAQELLGGQERRYDIRATRITGNGLSYTWRDVTDRYISEWRMRATLDSLMDPHVLFEAVRDERGQIVDFRFADANPAACAYDGIAYEDLVGSRMLQLYPGVVGAGLLKQYADVVESGQPLRLDEVLYAMETMGGRDRYLDISAVPVGDGLSYTWRDVTDRHQAMRDLEARLQELEQFQRVTVGRELKMIELKKEIEHLKEHGSAGSSDPGKGFET